MPTHKKKPKRFHSVTRCGRCMKLLTSGNKRLASAIWDSAIADRKPPSTDETTYAWCEECYEIVRKEWTPNAHA